MDEDLKLVFLHIPKTAGTSLRETMMSSIAEAEVCPERLDRLQQWDPRELAKYKFFFGHFSVDSLKCIPGRKKTATILRDPRKRLLSWYYFAKSHSTAHVENAAPELRTAKYNNLIDYLRVEGPHVPTMTQMLGAGDIGKAKENLSIVDAIGLTERADDSLAVISWQFGLPPLRSMPKLNVTGERVNDPAFEKEPPVREPLTEEIQSLIANLTEDDRYLYEHAKFIFERQFKLFTEALIDGRVQA